MFERMISAMADRQFKAMCLRRAAEHAAKAEGYEEEALRFMRLAAKERDSAELWGGTAGLVVDHHGG